MWWYALYAKSTHRIIKSASYAVHQPIHITAFCIEQIMNIIIYIKYLQYIKEKKHKYIHYICVYVERKKKTGHT